MKKPKISTIVTILVGCFSVVSTFVALGLSKKTPDTIHINTEEELFSIRDNLDGYYSLGADITITKPWVPIGSIDAPFTGTIIGNYHTIVFSNASLDFNDDGSSLSWGLIAYNKGTILKTNIYGIKISGAFDRNLNFGAFAVVNYGKITSCTIKNCDIKYSAPSTNFGSFVSYNHGDIRNCHLMTNFIIDVNEGASFFGGLCGTMSEGIIECCSTSRNSYLIANDIGNSNLFLGTAVGLFESGSVLNCYLSSASSQIKGAGGHYSVGTVAGFFRQKGKTIISSSYLDLRSYISASNSPSLIINGVFGVTSNYKIDESLLENLLIDINGSFSVDEECRSESYITFPSSLCENSYYLNHIINALIKNSDGAMKIGRDQLSLKLLRWDETIWKIENGEIIFLKTL